MERAASLETIERVYRERGGDFFRFALARTSDPELARDAVQDGFARAIRGRSGFRGSGPLEAWIARCVLNAAVDATRSKDRPLETIADAVDEAGAEDRHVPDEEIRAAIRGLPRRQRDALFLRYYLDFDYATIAEALDVEVGTVSATLHAARESLERAVREVIS